MLTTLSLSVAAGAFGLLTQIIFHNAQHERKVFFCAVPLVFVAIFVHMMAIIFGVLTKSALVSSVPALHSISWGPESAMVYLQKARLDHIPFWAMLQIIAFVAGTMLLFLVLVLNWKVLKRN